MAKSGFWLRGAKGKLAGTVLYQSNGSTVQREIVTPKNPQSDNQMRQRATFAGAAKFYQNAQQNRFVLAFQNKLKNQSNFNAFMQRNLREFDTLTYPTKEQANTPEFCNFFPWICTEGNLRGIPAAFPEDGADEIGAEICIADQDGVIFPTWDVLIAQNPTLNLQYGDIITVTIVLSDETFDDNTLEVVVGNVTPHWITRQIIIGADLEGNTLREYFIMNGFAFYPSKATGRNCMSVSLTQSCIELGIIEPSETFTTNSVAAMVCVTRSRRDGSQLKVSSSRFYLDDMAQRIFERLSSDTAMREAIESYKNSANSNITPSNILQGSVAEDFAEITSFRYYYNGQWVTQRVSKLTGVHLSPVSKIGVATTEIYIRTKKHIDTTAFTGTLQSGNVAFINNAEGTEQRVQLNAALETEGSLVFEIKLQGVTIASGTYAPGEA